MKNFLPSRRQREALQLRADGCTHKQTAHRMGISERTLDDYLEIARHKLQAETTTEAVAIAIRNGYIK